MKLKPNTTAFLVGRRNELITVCTEVKSPLSPNFYGTELSLMVGDAYEGIEVALNTDF